MVLVEAIIEVGGKKKRNEKGEIKSKKLAPGKGQRGDASIN
jgi:hypothetical protein